MEFIEWFFLVWFVVGLIGAAWFFPQGGFHTSRGERLVQLFFSASILVWLLTTGPLTWFGMVLVAVFGYNFGLGLAKLARHPEGTWTGTGWLTADAVVTALCLVALFTVGVVV